MHGYEVTIRNKYVLGNISKYICDLIDITGGGSATISLKEQNKKKAVFEIFANASLESILRKMKSVFDDPNTSYSVKPKILLYK